MNMQLTKPSGEYVHSRIRQFDGDRRYHDADAVVKMVFEQWPLNTDLRHVLSKVVILNRLYSTGVLDVYSMAEHIIYHKIDGSLNIGDFPIVSKIAEIMLTNKKTNKPKKFVFRSFAAKYCAWHQPEKFQIFDSYVVWILDEYRKRFQFAEFRKSELQNYIEFIRVMKEFRDFFSLVDFSRKEIDKFLWVEAKELMNSFPAEI